MSAPEAAPARRPRWRGVTAAVVAAGALAALGYAALGLADAQAGPPPPPPGAPAIARAAALEARPLPPLSDYPPDPPPRPVVSPTF
jgi:hypothetical protein